MLPTLSDIIKSDNVEVFRQYHTVLVDDVNEAILLAISLNAVEILKHLINSGGIDLVDGFEEFSEGACRKGDRKIYATLINAMIEKTSVAVVARCIMSHSSKCSCKSWFIRSYLNTAYILTLTIEENDWISFKRTLKRSTKVAHATNFYLKSLLMSVKKGSIATSKG